MRRSDSAHRGPHFAGSMPSTGNRRPRAQRRWGCAVDTGSRQNGACARIGPALLCMQHMEGAGQARATTTEDGGWQGHPWSAPEGQMARGLGVGGVETAFRHERYRAPVAVHHPRQSTRPPAGHPATFHLVVWSAMARHSRCRATEPSWSTLGVQTGHLAAAFVVGWWRSSNHTLRRPVLSSLMLGAVHLLQG